MHYLPTQLTKIYKKMIRLMQYFFGPQLYGKIENGAKFRAYEPNVAETIGNTVYCFKNFTWPAVTFKFVSYLLILITLNLKNTIETI